MTDSEKQPLAARLRPQCLTSLLGQDHLLAAGKPLRQALDSGQLHSMILWGPPGTGKTSLAHLLAQKADAVFYPLSAVMSGVKDVRQVIEAAKQTWENEQRSTVLFIDEVHRFNKAQQDAFLPFVEDGTITLIGATTENPSFALNNALLSRARVYTLKRLTEKSLQAIIQQALKRLGDISLSTELQAEIAQAGDGDARQCLNYLERIIELAQGKPITEKLVAEILREGVRRFDNQGECFYDLISALHKSIRGSDPDASLYWLTRMLDGGVDPLYLARRLVRVASEDIGNADPRALRLTLDAWETQERLGSPEGELALAQATLYLAAAPKSNAVYVAFNQAMRDVKQQGSLEVPIHLRNAPTKLMKSLGYGKRYRYAHDEPNAYAAGENYFPDGFSAQYYRPVQRGLEIKISAKLQQLKAWDKERAPAQGKRTPSQEKT